ncbi:hypothetical protein CJF32_00007094 [Rutstroemia sp. NJR-2017a WRK4]|nr:hypothetical protein CJF32_00007094 [Rutstroemia sp. NJR-2017a WRK4]
MHAMLLAFSILWLSAFNYNGVYAQSIQPLDNPIKALSSGEFGLPDEFHVHLHSYLPVHGEHGESIVLGTYTDDSDAQTPSIRRNKERRGLWSFLWSATKVFINPMSWTSGIQLGDLICKGVGWWTSAPSWVTWTCNSFGIISTMFSVWDGRKDLATAWNDFRNEGTYKQNAEVLELLPFYNHYGNVINNGGKRSDQYERGYEPGYYDWSVLHPHLANNTVKNAMFGNASIMHDVGRNYSIITMAHVLNSTDENPIMVQRSINGTLLGSPVSMFFVNSTGSSAGLGAHHAFGNSNSNAAKSRKREDGNCFGFGNDSGNIYADNTVLCGGDGTSTEDGITGVYYGMDFYGTEAQWEEYDADVGGQYPDSNGAWHLASELSSDTQNSQWWRTCLCDQESGTYSWTGALQYTWNGGFNGYSDCYSGKCGGAN